MDDFNNGIWYNDFIRSDTVMYLHLAMSRMILSTIGIKDGCDFEYLPTSAKAFTERNLPFGFVRKNKGSILLLLFSGHRVV